MAEWTEQDQIIEDIARQLDFPSIYMGRASNHSLRQAARVYENVVAPLLEKVRATSTTSVEVPLSEGPEPYCKCSLDGRPWLPHECPIHRGTGTRT